MYAYNYFLFISPKKCKIFLFKEALNNISDFISYIMHRSINPNATVLSANNTISLVNDYNTLETDPNEVYFQFYFNVFIFFLYFHFFIFLHFFISYTS